MKCAICARQAKGFGYCDPKRRRDDPCRYSHRWVFCSMRCMNAFGLIFEKTEGRMVDPTEMEQAAMQSCLAPLGECVAEIGMQRPLADYQRVEVLKLIEVVVTAYQAHMTAEHERLAKKERAHFEAQMNRQANSPRTGAPF